MDPRLFRSLTSECNALVSQIRATGAEPCVQLPTEVTAHTFKKLILARTMLRHQLQGRSLPVGAVNLPSANLRTLRHGKTNLVG